MKYTAKQLKKMDIHEVSKALGEYTACMSDELQEGIDALRSVADAGSYCFSDEFNKALEIEMKKQLKHISDNAVIETKTETYTQTYTTVRWLA